MWSNKSRFMSNKGAYIITIVTVGLSTILSYYYFNIWQKPLEEDNKSKPDFYITGAHLNEEYGKDHFLADVRYIGKTIEVCGSVTGSKRNEIIIDSFISCGFERKTKSVGTKKLVSIIGDCTGFDKVSNMIKLIDCKIKKNDGK